MASSLKDDPFPIYKSCYKRKASVDSTSMQDLMKIFGRCDWYSCPNGHLYAIGECRMAVMMSKCPECGEPIGGRFHRHLDTNHRIGAVNSSYNPMRYGMETEDKIEFKDVANVVHKTRQTGFDNNGLEINNNNNNRSLDTISENETSDWDKLKKQFEQMDDAPEYIVCPLSLDVFMDPVVTTNGTIYERKYIMDWLDNHNTDPMDSNIKLTVDDLESEDDVKQAAELWRKQKGININDENKNNVGLKWGSGHVLNEEHTSDDNWSDDNNEGEGNDNDVNINEFRNGLNTVLTVEKNDNQDNETNQQ